MNPPRKAMSFMKASVLLLLSLAIFVGCDKAKETVEETADQVLEKTEEVISERQRK